MSLKSINHLKISLAVILVAALMAGSGCRQDKANILFEGKTTDEIRTLSASSSADGIETKLVTGVPATASQSEGTVNGAAAEDKTGAIAVKMQY